MSPSSRISKSLMVLLLFIATMAVAAPLPDAQEQGPADMETTNEVPPAPETNVEVVTENEDGVDGFPFNLDGIRDIFSGLFPTDPSEAGNVLSNFAVNLTDFELPPGLLSQFEDFTSNLGESESCNFCDATNFDPSLGSQDTPCQEWASLATRLTTDDPKCSVLRSVAVQFCDCPTKVETTCSLCPNGNDLLYGDRTLWFLDGITCAGIAEMPAIDGCSAMESLSSYCGCSGAPLSCSLCGRDNNGDVLQKTRPLQVVVPGNPAEAVPDITCADLDLLLTLEMGEDVTNQEQDASGLMNSCEKAVVDAEDSIGVQLTGLCGCPGVQSSELCALCGDGYVFQKEKEECRNAASLAQFVTSLTRCEQLQKGAENFGCCALDYYANEEGNDNEDSDEDSDEENGVTGGSTTQREPLTNNDSAAPTSMSIFDLLLFVVCSIGFLVCF